MNKILTSLLCLTMLSTMAFLGGCVASAQKGVMDTGGESQLRLRQIQTRSYDTADKKKTLESVIATLQDLGFVIDKASYELGSVSATKLARYSLRMTVHVQPRGNDRMVVRANAQYNITAVDDPQPYKQFFEALSKSLFLQAHLED